MKRDPIKNKLFISQYAATGSSSDEPFKLHTPATDKKRPLKWLWMVAVILLDDPVMPPDAVPRGKAQ